MYLWFDAMIIDTQDGMGEPNVFGSPSHQYPSERTKYSFPCVLSNFRKNSFVSSMLNFLTEKKIREFLKKPLSLIMPSQMQQNAVTSIVNLYRS